MTTAAPEPSAGDVCVVLVTAPSPEAARTLARALVEASLAACANLVPVTSVYRWQGELREDGETLLVLKSRRSRFAELEAKVRALHSYEVPEVLMLEVAQGHRPYLSWVLGEVP